MKYKSGKDGEVIKQIDYLKKKIFSGNDFNKPGLLLQTVIIPPITKQRLHVHHFQTEVYLILKGECEIVINNISAIANPGDAFIVSPEDTHYLWNKSDQEFSLVVFKYDVPFEEDIEWLE
jgi:mannose-6-phosphate isomerase-like protein (cupin superfamily)